MIFLISEQLTQRALATPTVEKSKRSCRIVEKTIDAVLRHDMSVILFPIRLFFFVTSIILPGLPFLMMTLSTVNDDYSSRYVPLFWILMDNNNQEVLVTKQKQRK